MVAVALWAMLTAVTPQGPAVEAPLMRDAAPLSDPGRYRSPLSYEETLDFYARTFNQLGVGVRWRNIINAPTIKAKHIESLRDYTRWSGINIYEKNGEVRIFVLSREKEKNNK